MVTLAKSLAEDPFLKGFHPFWDEGSLYDSSKAWQPQNINESSYFQHSDMKVFTPIDQNACNDKISIPDHLYESLHTDFDDIYISTRKVRFYPNKVQRTFLDQYFGAHRYFYNATIEYLVDRWNIWNDNTNENCPVLGCANKKFENYNVCGDHKHQYKYFEYFMSEQSCRNLLLLTFENLPEDQKWQQYIQNATKAAGIFKAVRAFKLTYSKYKYKGFKMKYALKKNKSQICHIRNSAIFEETRKKYAAHAGEYGMCDQNILNPNIFNDVSWKNHRWLKMRKRAREKLKRDLPANSKDYSEFQIQKTGINYYLIYVIKQPTAAVANRDKVLVIDPGVRNVITGYSPNGHCIQTSATKFKQSLRKLDERIQDINAKNPKNASLAKAKLRLKQLHIKQEMHNQIASYLVRKYDILELPKLSYNRIVRRKDGQRTIPKEVARTMQLLAVNRLNTRIAELSKKYHCNVLRIREDYTTRTCGACGKDQEVGAASTYVCETCNHTIDRDMNAARNIYLLRQSLYRHNLSIVVV